MILMKQQQQKEWKAKLNKHRFILLSTLKGITHEMLLKRKLLVSCVIIAIGFVIGESLASTLTRRRRLKRGRHASRWHNLKARLKHTAPGVHSVIQKTEDYVNGNYRVDLKGSCANGTADLYEL